MKKTSLACFVVLLALLISIAVASAAEYQIGDKFSETANYSGKFAIQAMGDAYNGVSYRAEDFVGASKLFEVKAASKLALYPWNVVLAAGHADAQLVLVNANGRVAAVSDTGGATGILDSKPNASFGFDCPESGTVWLVALRKFSGQFMFKLQ